MIFLLHCYLIWNVERGQSSFANRSILVDNARRRSYLLAIYLKYSCNHSVPSRARAVLKTQMKATYLFTFVHIVWQRRSKYLGFVK